MNSVGPNLWYTLDGWPLHGLRDQKSGIHIKNTGKTQNHMITVDQPDRLIMLYETK